jgi:hypothetical protein
MRKRKLRECAARLFRQRGYDVALVGGRGVTPGARLRVVKDDRKQYEVAVRTSTDREIGCTRRLDGEWSTLPKMDEVIVVVPSTDDPALVEVFSFDPQVVVSALNKALDAEKARRPNLSYKVPIFIALDDLRRGPKKEMTQGIKHACNWSELASLSEEPTAADGRTEPVGQFIERVKREYALLNKVDVSKVRVAFTIDS